MMNKNNDIEIKCKMCGKIIVGKNKTGICSAYKKKAGDTVVSTLGIISLISGGVWATIKTLNKNK